MWPNNNNQTHTHVALSAGWMFECLRESQASAALPIRRRVGSNLAPCNSFPQSLSMAAAKRLRKELDEMAQNPEPFCTAGPVGDDLFVWKAVLTGPPDSPYDGGRFLL